MGRTELSEIFKSLFPAILFMILYETTSFKLALVGGFLIGGVIYSIEFRKNNALSSMDKLGIFGLVTQTSLALLAKNPKTYFIYPIIENLFFAGVFLISLLLKTDAVTYISKDFTEGKSMKALVPLQRKLTFLWGIYYIVKAIIKIIGYYNWTFETLYWVSWLTGTPMFIAMIWASFYFPKRKYSEIVSKENADNSI